MPSASPSRRLVVISLLVLGAAGSLAGSPAAGQATGAPTATAARGAVRAGDVIRLRIWREPEFSGEFPVDRAGNVVLPRIGATHVQDETQESLTARLVETYGRFLTHRAVDVTVLRRVQVLGAVRTPGLYTVEPTMTVSDAVALAGGATVEGRPNNVRVLREGRAVAGNVVGRTTVGDLQIRSGDQLFVPERSWLSRNPGIVAALITGVVLVLTTVVR